MLILLLTSAVPRNDVSCREPVDIFYQPPQPPNGPTAYCPQATVRSVSTEMQPLPRQRVPDCLRSHCLSARFPEVFFFKKHSKESTNSVSAIKYFRPPKVHL